MRNTIVIFCLLNSLFGFSQKTFSDSPCLWQAHSLMSWTSGPGQTHADYFYRNYFLSTDLVSTNDKIYRKLFITTDTVFNQENISSYKFLYDDSNKVYIGDSASNMRLILDFNLNVADSFCFNAKIPFWLQVQKVDSILISGHYKKKITFESLPDRQPLIWVQGIGDITYGDHFSSYQTIIEWSFFSDRLDCYSENNISLFGNNCRLSNSIPDFNTTKRNFLVFPNPTKGDLTIQSNDNKVWQIHLYNTNGRLLLSDKLSKVITIDLHNYKRGLYFLQIFNTERVEVLKFLKE